MGRLIDEEVLLDKHAEQCGEKSCDTCRLVRKEKCASYVAIVETPTAYDVEAVVKELEEEAKKKRSKAYGIPNAEISLFAQYLLGMASCLEDDAIENVRMGGVKCSE